MGICKSQMIENQPHFMSETSVDSRFEDIALQLKQRKSVLTEYEESKILSYIVGASYLEFRQYNIIYEGKTIGDVLLHNSTFVKRVEMGFRTILCCPPELEKEQLEIIYKNKLFIYLLQKN